MSTPPVRIERAKLREWSGDGPKTGGREAQVQFNPATLTLQLDARADPRDGTRAAKTPWKDNATLNVNLLFDTSVVDGHAPRDVQEQSRSIWAFLTPMEADGDGPLRPPELGFSWGKFLFIGTMVSCSETLQAFTADGTPFRAELQITLAGHRPGAQ